MARKLSLSVSAYTQHPLYLTSFVFPILSDEILRAEEYYVLNPHKT